MTKRIKKKKKKKKMMMMMMMMMMIVKSCKLKATIKLKLI